MGLFQKNKNPVCSICNTRESSKKLIDGYICKDCMAKCYPFITVSWFQNTVEQIRYAISVVGTNRQLLQIYKPTKKINNLISFDEKNGLWRVPNKDIIFRYEDFIGYNLEEVGERKTVTKGGHKSALVGGLLFGPAGAIVGSNVGAKTTTTITGPLKMDIATKHLMCPKVQIILYTATKKKDAQQIAAQFSLIEDTVKSKSAVDTAPKAEQTSSNVDELRKYKELFDEGVITEEEFNAKKKQLLGL